MCLMPDALSLGRADSPNGRLVMAPPGIQEQDRITGFGHRRDDDAGSRSWVVFQITAEGRQTVMASFNSEAECLESLNFLNSERWRMSARAKHLSALRVLR
jgi:hypothetical protein